MKDYYAILGLDPEASSESIKVAYRRLANQYHPDRLIGAKAEQIARSSELMREINEAYAALSKGGRQRAGQRNDGNGNAPSVVVPAAPRRAEAVRPDASAMFSSISVEFSQNVRRALAASGMKWHEETFEGFNWVMVSTSLLSKYAVAFRGFASMDPDVTRKFANYAELALEKSSGFRRNFLLFLIAFQRITRAEEVATTCRFFSSGKRKGKVAEIEIALVDVGNARTVLCGPKVRDERYARLLQQIGVTK